MSISLGAANPWPIIPSSVDPSDFPTVGFLQRSFKEHPETAPSYLATGLNHKRSDLCLRWADSLKGISLKASDQFSMLTALFSIREQYKEIDPIGVDLMLRKALKKVITDDLISCLTPDQLLTVREQLLSISSYYGHLHVIDTDTRKRIVSVTHRMEGELMLYGKIPFTSSTSPF